jgi:hypothetical protein
MEDSAMPSGPGVYPPGVDEVGLPKGEDQSGSGQAFDFGGVFGQVKDWLVKNDDKVIQVVVPWLKKTIKAAAGSGLDSLDMPDSTPITAMVLPSQIARLSPAVKKLTKLDLQSLGGWGVARKLPSELGLTAKDIQTIRDVFTPQMNAPSSLDEQPEAWSLSCCSCTPCCCAAAVINPVRLVA